MKKPIKKKVDESWKASVEKKKTTLNDEASNFQKKDDLPKVNFLIHISQLAMQSMVFLGLIKHPKGDEVPVDLLQSQYLIDTIEMLQNKCGDSLTEEEKNGVSNILYDLRLKFLDVQKQKVSPIIK